MNKKRVLILGTSAPQYDAVEVLRSMGFNTCVVGKEKGIACNIADEFFLYDFLNISQLKKLIIEKGFMAVYSVGSELAMRIACGLSEELGLPSFVSKKTAILCSDKGEMRRILGQNFPANVKNIVIKDKNYKTLLPYPFIMKPVDSQGQRGIRLIRSIHDFDKAYDEIMNYSRNKQIIIEEYIEGDEFSFNGYVINSKLVFSIISDRVTWENKGLGLVKKHIMPSIKISKEHKKRAFEIIQSAIEILGILNGPVYCQFKIKNDDIKIIEITPRWDGCHLWRLIFYLTGKNFLELTFEHMLFKDTKFDFSIYNVDKIFELEFFCEEPEKSFNKDKFILPENIFNFFYYNNGDLIRSINGIYEKVGYYIRQIK